MKKSNLMKRFLAFALSSVMALSAFAAAGPAIEARAEETSANLALGKPVVASGGNPTRAVDGDTENYWDGGVAPSWLIVDLEGYYDLDKVNVITYYGGSRYYHYDVYASADGVTYDVVGEKHDDSKSVAAGNTFNIDGDNVYRYVKVNMTYNSANPSVHINELSVYGTEVTDFEAPERPTTDVNDPDNIAYGKPTRSTTNSDWTMLAVDGDTDSSWAGEDYPKYVDVDLLANYDINKIEVYMPVKIDHKENPVTFSYEVYGSLDGVNFTTIAQSGVKAPTVEGDTYTFETPLNYRVVRVNVTSNSTGEGANSQICEIKVYGEENGTEVIQTRDDIVFDSYETWLQKNYGVDVNALKDENGSYDMDATYTEADSIEAVEGVITRLLGAQYIDWFNFDIVPSEDPDKDYYEISNDADGKIKIVGNEGLSLTSALNHYLKYYCNVHVSQQTAQVDMPENIVPVKETIYKASPYEVRYAYNYCTLSYTMPFWGYDEWQRELDYFALNGVNLILDTTATEALWVKYLMNYGYDVEEAKAFVCGYSYKAWWLMGNLESYGGPVSDQWVTDMVEMARHNQRFMTVLGMEPCLQGFMGALPEHFADVANETLMGMGFSDVNDYMVAQGDWSGFTRPPILKTTYDGWNQMAETFYNTQEYIYGQVTKYYAGDLAHEGGIIPPDLSKPEMSAHILNRMMTYDEDAVWIIQSWLSNPDPEILWGFGEHREDHVLVLDLDSTENPHWNNTTNWNGKEFGGTSWVYCMLDNYGGRTGMHGELKLLATQIAYANAHSEHMKGIGITPEGTLVNPVNYDLFWEMVWETEAIDVDEWVKNYITRRYGEFSEKAYEGWKLLMETAYGYCKEDGSFIYHTGNNNSIVNMRPNFKPEIVIGDYAIRYDVAKFEKAAKLILEEFDKFADNECYVYDVVDLLRQVVSNTDVAYHSILLDAYYAGDTAIFGKYKDKLLESILLIDELSSYEEDSLVGVWIDKARDFAVDERYGSYDDYSKDMMEINAKAIVSAWSSKTLQTYGHRQYNGMMEDYNYPMWKQWLEALETAMETGEYVAPTTSQDYFNHAWNFVINEKDYQNVPSAARGDENARGLLAIAEDVFTNHLSGQTEKDQIVDDNVADEGTAYAETTLGGYVASRLNDGDGAGLWIAASNAVPVYCGITFKNNVDVYGLQLIAETRATLGANVMGYYIEAKDASGNWKKIYTGDTYDENAGKYTTNITLDKVVTTKDIRITFTSNGGIYPALAEIKVFSSEGIKAISSADFTLANGKITGVEYGTTVDEIKEFLTWGQGILVFKDANGNTLVGEDALTTGTTVQLIYGSKLVLDKATITVKEPEIHVHAWSDWFVVEEATTEKEGLKRRECACGEFEEEVIPKVEIPVVFEITKQPESAAAVAGANAEVTVEATGKDLTYTWYYKNPGNVKYYESGDAFITNGGATYSIPMYAWRNGQKVYCVVTDASGKMLVSNTVTVSLKEETGSIEIKEQPVNAEAANGEKATVSVVAAGEGLTYTWYYKNPGNVKFYVSGADFVDGATYSIPMSAWRDGQEVYCVITDANGVSVQTNTVKLTLAK